VAKKLRVIEGSSASDTMPIPAGLEPHGAELWAQVHREYEITDVGGCEMLRQACAALDMAFRCRRRIDTEGEIIVGRTMREHPLLKYELQNRAFVVRTLARLGLAFEALRSGPGRPGGFQ
jgi:hypothetical protein